MKARLHAAGIAFAKTHNLVELLDAVLPIEPLWESLRGELKALNEYAIVFRYPGESADKPAVKRAFDICKGVRGLARKSLRVRD